MSSDPEGLKKSIRFLLFFQVFNAFNFTLALGAPLVLTARYIGASESQIGLLTSLMPLLVSLQVIGTVFVTRLGYRRTMILGWGGRSFMLLGIVPLPFLVSRLETSTLVLLLFLSILGFTFIRGMASAAWFPWLSTLLPEDRRGNFLGKEARVMNISGFSALMLCGWFLGDKPDPWRYSMMFLAAWAAGMGSIWMLSRVPETGAGRDAKTPGITPRKLLRTFREIWAHPPFRRTILFVGMFSFAMVAQPIFLVLYVKEELGLSEGNVLKLQAAATLGVLLSAVFWGRMSDRIGSRPLLRLCDIGIFSTVLFWTGSALGVYTPTLEGVYAVYFVGGIFAAAHGVSQSRLLLGCCPQKSLTLAMALFQVIASLCGGMAPIFFGLLLEQIRPDQITTGGKSMAFAVLFSSFLLLGILSQFLLSHVPDPRRMPTRHVLMHVFYGWPVRVLEGLVMEGRRRK